MKDDKLYAEFERLGERLGIRIVKGKGDFVGGTCMIHDQTVIVINKMKPLEQRLKTLASSFLEYTLDDIYIVPALRAYIEDIRSLDL